jgi:hypothetical protein
MKTGRSDGSGGSGGTTRHSRAENVPEGAVGLEEPVSEKINPKVEEVAAAQGRKFERHSCRLRLRCRRFKGVGLYDSTEQYLEGMVRNRSMGGFLLETSIHFPVDAKLEISFHTPDNSAAYLGVVTVRWVKRMASCFYLGVSTDHLDSL